MEGVVVRFEDDSDEVYGFPRGAGPQFSQGDGGDVLRKNGRGEGIGLRRVSYTHLTLPTKRIV